MYNTRMFESNWKYVTTRQIWYNVLDEVVFDKINEGTLTKVV